MAASPVLAELGNYRFLFYATDQLGRSRSTELPAGTLRDQTLLQTDVQLGYWLLRNLPWFPFTLLAPHS